jgi:hypothetical protein
VSGFAPRFGDVERPVRKQPVAVVPIAIGAGAVLGPHAMVGGSVATGAVVEPYAVLGPANVNTIR